MKFLSFLFPLILAVSCLKTADQVQRERNIDAMTEQMKDSQGLLADMLDQMKSIQNQLDKQNGRIDELEHLFKQKDQSSTAQSNETLQLMKAQQEKDSQLIEKLQNDMNEQRKFIEKVTTSLSASTQQEKPQKKSAKTELSAALELVKKNAYQEARNELMPLINHPDLTPGDHNKVLHALGRVEFYTKNYDKSLVYFSKIYSRFPKASLAPSSLLFIGRTLDKMGKKDEAKEAFAKVTEDYANTPEAKEAKKEM